MADLEKESMTVAPADPFARRGRILPLQGGCNFRDIGGYRTEHGRTIRWRRVYRAGLLGLVEPAGYGIDNDSTDPAKAEWSANITAGPYLPESETGTLYGEDTPPFSLSTDYET